MCACVYLFVRILSLQVVQASRVPLLTRRMADDSDDDYVPVDSDESDDDYVPVDSDCSATRRPKKQRTSKTSQRNRNRTKLRCSILCGGALRVDTCICKAFSCVYVRPL